MKGGTRRKTISSEIPPPPQHSVQPEITDQEDDQVEYEQREPQQQQPINDGDDDGSECDEEEGEDDGEDDQSGDGDIQERGADGGENKGDEERPKLAEGFYEIEAVRKKRIRKGEPQYLIKWRGWPEAANTWEPVENLMSCPDVIDAFEDSIRSRKQRTSRKHKRRQSLAPTPQPKKKQKQQPEEGSPAATYHVPSVTIKVVEKPPSVPSVHNSNFSNGTETNVGGKSHNERANQRNDIGSSMDSPQIGEREERNEFDVSLGGLKVTSSSNQENVSEFAIHIQEDRPTEGVTPVEVRHSNGMSKVDGTEVIMASSRVGARRRKSGAVKRFKQESNSAPRNDAHDALANADSVVVGENTIKNVDAVGNGMDSNNIIDAPPSVSVITKIVKPVNYSTSILNDTEEVSVSFLVRRSDGEEVVVNNKYLKENNPLLLINFYEQHLRYNCPSE